MDPPPLPPHPQPTVPAATATTITPTSIPVNYPDSVDSSPRSHTADTYNNEPLPPVPGAKLRLMCSYGGHIIPRPHDKSLCYVGGETRMVVVDRRCCLSSLSTRLSRTLLNGRPFTIKYQLPHEDLDSLVSVTTDEDLENMIEEYDRITSSSSSMGSAPSRIRLFLFFNKPETAASMGPLLDDAKSETWFVDALNGSGLFPRNLSDSATMGCLVNLDSYHDLEAQAEGPDGIEAENKQAKTGALQDVHVTMLDSPMVENGSSFGSTSSTPSTSNLPPIRVRVEDQMGGMEEQFAQMTFAQVVQKQDDGGLYLAPPPPIPTTIAAVGTVASIAPAGGSSEHLNRVVSDDERSDHGVPVSFRKPPLPLQPVQPKPGGACCNLPSPDSVASEICSDTSIASASSLSKPMCYQEQAHVAALDSRAPASPDTDGAASIPSSQIQMQQVQDSGYSMPQQLERQQQQKFVHASTHFIPHPASAAVPISSYYQIYAHPPAPPQQQSHPPFYIMPAGQAQPYMSTQSNMVDNNVAASTRAVTTPTPTVLAAPTPSHPLIYSTKNAGMSAAKPEMAASVYRTAMAQSPSLVQVPAAQYQQQYVGYSQVQHPSQSISVASAAAVANYGYEYANATHDQVYYTQHQAAAAAAVAPLPPQYQTMTPATAVALTDASSQLSPPATMQQTGTSQPLQ